MWILLLGSNLQDLSIVLGFTFFYQDLTCLVHKVPVRVLGSWLRVQLPMRAVWNNAKTICTGVVFAKTVSLYIHVPKAKRENQKLESTAQKVEPCTLIYP